MKKLLGGLMLVWIAIGMVVNCQAANEVEITGLSFTGNVDLNQADIDVSTIGYLHLGSSATFGNGIAVIPYVYTNAPAPNYAGFQTFTISTTALASQSTTWITKDFTRGGGLSFPTNLIFFSSESIAGTVAITSATVTGTAKITGINTRGHTVTENITIVSTPNAVGCTGIGIGSYTYTSISSVTIEGFTSSVNIFGSTHKICIGTGQLLGVPNDIVTSDDIYYVTGDFIYYSSSTVNTTYDTIKTPVAPDGAIDWGVLHKVRATP